VANYTPETYFLNPAHEAIARSRYYLKDSTGALVEKDIFEAFRRVNDYVYQNDLPEHKELAQRLCEEKKIMYAGRPLAQAGTGIKNMFNCFVLGIDDSRESISECQRIHFHIQAHGGGTGINFSKLRPSGAWCKGANARSSGPEGFITAMGYLSSNIQQGGNRCLPGDALVAMADGSWRRIDQVREGDTVLAFDKASGAAVPSQVLKFFENGIQDVYEYRLASGKSIRSTDSHRWLGVQTDGSFLVRTVKDMPESSTKIGFIQNLPYFGQNTSVWAPILGYLLGDGCFTGDTVKLSVQNDLVRERFVASIPEDCSYWENEGNVFISSKGELQKYLQRTALYRCRAHEKFIPEEIFTYTRQDLINIIEGLFATDGSVNEIEVAYYSTSKRLVEDVSKLLLKFGVSGYIQADNRSRRGKVRRTLWSLRIKHPTFYNRFVETFNVPGKVERPKANNSISHRLRDDVYFHKVQEIVNLGPDATYCIEIDHPDHLFVVDGAVSHNSGANMGILEDWHPGLLKFITKKSRGNWENVRKFAVVTDENRFKQWQWMNPYPWQTFNVSVALSDEFMRQVKRQTKKPWVLHWKDEPWHLWDFEVTLRDYAQNGDVIELKLPITVCAPDEEIARHEAMNEVPFRNSDKLTLKSGPYDITAHDWFRRICTNAWEDGCPGIFFIDRAREFHNGEYFNPLDATNPCAEQVLPQWSVCCLSSVVLPEFVKGDDMDWDALKEAVRVLVRSLNWITLLNETGVEQIDYNTKQERRIGLGTIGMHEALIRLSLAGEREYVYSQDSGRAMAKKILKFIKHAAYEASIDLAAEIGPFPAYQYEGFIQSKFIQQLLKERPDFEEKLRTQGIANVTILTQAPTGTTGTITGYSSGCEPYFAMAYQRNSNVGTIMDGCPSFHLWLKEKDIDYSQYGFNLKELRKHKRVPKFFEEAQDISWQDHLAMQAMFAEQIDSSVSKCLAEGTLINTNKGLIPIEQCGSAKGIDVFGPPVENLAIVDEYGQHRKVLSHYSAGEKEATRITLQNGSSICGARDSHRVKTVDGWKTLGELAQEDLVFVNDEFEVFDVVGNLPIDVSFDRKTNANYVNLPKQMSVSLAKILGMLAADGHLQESTGKVSLYEKAPTVGQIFDYLSKEVFDVVPEVEIDSRTGVVEHRITSRPLVRYLRNLIGYRSATKKVPDQILRGSFSEKKAFVEGITLDGYVREGRGLVVYEGRSQILAYQVSELLRSFGKPAVYCGKKWVADHNYYTHSVMVSEELQDLIVPLEAHKKVPSSYHKTSHLVAFDRKEFLARGRISTKHPNYSAARNLWQRNLSYCTQDLAEKLGLRVLGKVSKIGTIEHLGKVAMYDVEVAQTHNYLVSGIVSHNTINLPSNATVDDIMGAYIGAYDMNIKSTAVYRDGSKTQILETLKNYAKNSEARPQTIVTIQAPKRPDDLKCHIHAVSVKGDKWKVLVGILHGKPYEIFCFPEEQISIPANKTEGILQKNGHGRYNLVIGTGEDAWTIKNVAQLLLTDEHRMITRLLSTSLRHGAPLSAILGQLAKCEGDVTTFSKALLRVLKKYITEEEYLEASRCRSCGSKQLVMEQGCLQCKDCGYSGCD
jgi:ribonucleotide reductase alpha subunit